MSGEHFTFDSSSQQALARQDAIFGHPGEWEPRAKSFSDKFKRDMNAIAVEFARNVSSLVGEAFRKFDERLQSEFLVKKK